MEYQRIINLLDNTPDQPSKFRTKNWVNINDDSRETYNTNSQMEFKTTMLKSSLCDYSDVYILLKGTMNVAGAEATAEARQNDRNKQAIFKNYAPFTDCVTEINNLIE